MLHFYFSNEINNSQYSIPPKHHLLLTGPLYPFDSFSTLLCCFKSISSTGQRSAACNFRNTNENKKQKRVSPENICTFWCSTDPLVDWSQTMSLLFRIGMAFASVWLLRQAYNFAGAQFNKMYFLLFYVRCKLSINPNCTSHKLWLFYCARGLTTRNWTVFWLWRIIVVINL